MIKIDDNPAATAVSGGGGNVFELHKNGSIWQYTGTPISGWVKIADNPAATRTAVGYNGTLYELDNTGMIWAYNGTPITGWTKLDDNTATAAFSASTPTPATSDAPNQAQQALNPSGSTM